MKKLIALTLAAMMLVFAGCSNEAETEPTTQPETESFTDPVETEVVTAMGNIVITRADTVFEGETAEAEDVEAETSEEDTEAAAESEAAEESEENPVPENQSGSNADALIGGWQYVYEDSGYMIIERIYLNKDGSAAFGYGVYAGEYIAQYEGTWYEENGTVYLDLVGGHSEWSDEEERTIREQNELTMQLGWKENGNGITFIDYEDAIVIGDAPGSAYDFVTSEI